MTDPVDQAHVESRHGLAIQGQRLGTVFLASKLTFSRSQRGPPSLCFGSGPFFSTLLGAHLCQKNNCLEMRATWNRPMDRTHRHVHTQVCVIIRFSQWEKYTHRNISFFRKSAPLVFAMCFVAFAAILFFEQHLGGRFLFFFF